jgi:hypothetical protein
MQGRLHQNLLRTYYRKNIPSAGGCGAPSGLARVKTQSHWQSDVIAGAALGTAVGYYMHLRDRPFILNVMPHGIQVGLRKQF